MDQETVDYRLCIIVGGDSAGRTPQNQCTEIHVPADKDYISILEKSGLTASDPKTKTLVVLRESSLEALVTYAALCGMASRTLDCEINDVLCRFLIIPQIADSETPLDHLSPPEDTLIVGTGPGTGIDFAQMLEKENIVRIRNAKKVVLTGAFTANPNISGEEFLALVQTVMLVASVRQKPAGSRYPALHVSDTYDVSDLAKIQQGDTSFLVDLEAIRKEGGKIRRSSRTDDRTELMPPIDLTSRQRVLLQAADTNVEETLTKLKSHRNQDTGLWRCSRPQNHRNGDANPSSHVEDNRVRCYKCDLEPLDSLRLVMETLNISPDDAAVWLLSGK